MRVFSVSFSGSGQTRKAVWQVSYSPCPLPGTKGRNRWRLPPSLTRSPTTRHPVGGVLVSELGSDRSTRQRGAGETDTTPLRTLCCQLLCVVYVYVFRLTLLTYVRTDDQTPARVCLWPQRQALQQQQQQHLALPRQDRAGLTPRSHRTNPRAQFELRLVKLGGPWPDLGFFSGFRFELSQPVASQSRLDQLGSPALLSDCSESLPRGHVRQVSWQRDRTLVAADLDA